MLLVGGGALVLLVLATPAQRPAVPAPPPDTLAPTAPPSPLVPATPPAAPAPATRLLPRLTEALPGPALLVQRRTPDEPWRPTHLNAAARQQATSDWTAASSLADWLEQMPDWPGEAMLDALEDAGPVTDRLDAVLVLPLDLQTAVLWLPPRQGGSGDEQNSLAYTVSHDLRAPIRVVEGFARIVREDYGGVLDRIGNDHLDRILGAAARMNHMIDSILALSKLSSQPIARQTVDLSQMALQILDELQRQNPQRQLDARIEPGLLAQGDPTLLRMLLDNLLGNAWKYSARCAITCIEFGREQLDGRSVFVVRDHGAGFDMRFASRMFSPFQRLHSASEFAGHGVGLASVKRIVERHGGRISAEGEVDRGATFRFSLG